MQNPGEHETLSVACHVGLWVNHIGFHIGLLLHSNFLGPLGPQAVVESEEG